MRSKRRPNGRKATAVLGSCLVAVLTLMCSSTSAQTQSNASLYTSVEAKSCRTVKSGGQEADSYTGRCRGIGGYSLIVEEGDLRTNIKVVTPSGRQHSLELWSVVSSGFSSLGPKAEWRLAKRGSKSVPVALIIRYNASEDAANPNRTTSYLVVSKLTPEQSCVTDKIGPGANSNIEARRAADLAPTKTCLKAQ